MTLSLSRPFFALALAIGLASGTAQAQSLPDFSELVEKFGPTVVNINTQSRGRPAGRGGQVPGLPPGLSEDDPFFEFFRRFMPPDAQQNTPRGRTPQQGPNQRPQPLRPLGLGSGFIISKDGHIITNAHVVENAEEITVRLTDKREFTAKVIGADKRSDIAVLKVEATNLPVVKIGNSARLKTGEWVVAIGSPFNFSNTVTAGIVSATSRDNLSEPNMDAVPFIQTDVAVNPGNSGGPLLNLKGEVVGINSQIYSPSGAFAGISFAIPIDYAMAVANQLQAGGRVTRGRIGVSIGNVSRDVAESLKLPRATGAMVGGVEDDSPAAKAGVEVGDVILKVDGRDIESSAELSRMIRQVKPGQPVKLTVWRGGKTREIPVTVIELKEDTPAKAAPAKAKPDVKTGKLGVAVSELTAEQKKKFKTTTGVAVDAADGAALAAGIQPGDAIVRVNGIEITSVKVFSDTIAKLDLKKAVTVIVRDENGSRVTSYRPDPD